MLVDADNLVVLARNAQEPLSEPLRFGVIPTVGPMSCPRCCRIWQCTAEAQTIRVGGSDAVLLDKLAAGELDLLLAAIPFELGDVEAMEIAKDPIVVAMPRNHPLARHKVLRRDDLAREQLLLIEDGHCLRSQ